MRVRRFRLLALIMCVLVAAALLAGCAGKQPPAEKKEEPEKEEAQKPAEPEKPKEPIKLGGIFDITGPTGDVGTPYHDGAVDAVNWINSRGGINGGPIKLIDIDYAYKIPQAVEAYNKLVQQEKVVAIMGWGTGDTEAMVPFITKDKIPYMSASYSENLLEIETHPYNFLVAPSYSDQARAVIKWVKDNWKDKSRTPRVALIYNDTGFGRSPIQDAKDYAKEIGVDIVDEEIVDLRALDATSQLLNMQKKDPDFAIIQQTSMATSTILKDSKKLGLRTQFVGLNWAADENIPKLAGEAAEGYMGVIPFAFPYEDVPGLRPIREYLASQGKKLDDKIQKYVQGWASILVMAEGIKRAGDEVTGETIKKGLETLRNFDLQGLAAPVTFTPQSHRGATTMKIYQVKDGKFQPITGYISAR